MTNSDSKCRHYLLKGKDDFYIYYFVDFQIFDKWCLCTPRIRESLKRKGQLSLCREKIKDAEADTAVGWKR